jgi:hypothetical protein
MATTGRIVGPLWAGLAMDRLDLGAPFVLAGGLTFAALALFWLWRGTLLEDAGGAADA